jgi:ATP-dependent RNA helicase TDRD9
MQVYGKVKILQGKPIKVEDDSVNSVLLDDQPGDPHERLLVAASVCTLLLYFFFILFFTNPTRFEQVLTNQMGDKVVVRGTTLMPNIHGLPSLLTLLFAPRAEFRSDEKRTRLIGAICGLGYDAQRDQSICPDHDMEIAFDKEIDNEVISFFLMD